MKPLILVVEDDPKILLGLEQLLEFNDYQPITATDGEDALEKIFSASRQPDLIISDIMMPKMNGYEFYTKISEKPGYNKIPFIFLSAKSDPDDVRFGKHLGVDDYITKPFDEEDLLASISGKIKRQQRIQKGSEEFEKKLSELFNKKPSLVSGGESKVILFEMEWDEAYGPKLTACSPESSEIAFNIEEIGIQLFQIAQSMYGYDYFLNAEGVFLRIANIDQYGFIFFDASDDASVRGGKALYMLTVLAPKMNYLETLRIQEILESISKRIKKQEPWQIEPYRRNVIEILSVRQ